MKSRGRSRGWLSATKERVVGGEFKRGCDGSLHWRVAERQAGEVQSILRQKGTLGLWNIHSSQLETETQSDRAEEAPEDWRDSTSPPKHSLLKIKHRHIPNDFSWGAKGEVVSAFFNVCVCLYTCIHMCAHTRVYVSIKVCIYPILQLQTEGTKPQQ